MFFEDFSVGQSWQVAPFTISREQIIDFARLYDPLPVHTDEQYAKTTRFKGLIASGPMTFMLFWTEFIKAHDILGEELIAGLENHMEWPVPTYPGDTLQGTVSITAMRSRNAYNGVIDVEIKAYNQDGVRCMGGGATICFAKRPSG